MAMTGKLASGVAAAAIIACASGGALAQDKLREVLDRGHLVVGTGSANAPFHFINEAGELDGFDIDIGRIIAHGIFDDPSRVAFVDQSADSRIPNLMTDKVDVVCQFMTVTAQRALQVEFTVPYYREGSALLVRTDGRFKTYEEMLAAGSDVTLSIIQNSFAEEYAHRALPEARVDQYESVDLVVQAVRSGRADGGAVDTSNTMWLQKQHPDIYADAGYYWLPQNYACAVAKGDQEWLNLVNTALTEAMTGAEFPRYAAAFERWYGVKLPDPEIGFPY